jgi:hypothetical protein
LQDEDFSYSGNSNLTPPLPAALLMLGVSYTNDLEETRALGYLKTWMVNNPDYQGTEVPTTADRRQETTGRKEQTVGSKQQTAYSRQQAVDGK